MSYYDDRWDDFLDSEEPGLDHRKLRTEILGGDMSAEQSRCDRWCRWIEANGYRSRLGVETYELHREFDAWELEQARNARVDSEINKEVRHWRQVERERYGLAEDRAHSFRAKLRLRYGSEIPD